MNERPMVLLLPGLDGTGRLFTRLVAAIEPSAQTRIVTYPDDRFLCYDELANCVPQQAPITPYVIVAESFSGPIAALVASRGPKGLRGVIFFTSFVAPPAPRFLHQAPLGYLLRISLSAGLVRFLLLDSKTGADVVTDVVGVIRGVPPALLAARLREVLTTDASEALRTCPGPVVYVAGAKDRVLGTRGLRHVQSVRPDAETATIQGPHLLLQTRVNESAVVISRYLRRWFAS